MNGGDVNDVVLVGFDVHAIQAYVFAPIRPIDISGGSWLLERFGRDVRTRIERDHGGRTVYVGGGNGMFVLPELAVARRAADEIERLFAKCTKGGAICSAAVGVGPDFQVARRELAAALHARKNGRWLEEATVDLRSPEPPGSLCQACGREPPVSDPDRVGDRSERIGEQCRVRRQAGRTDEPAVPGLVELAFARDLEALLEPPAADGAGDRSSRALAVLYLDADRAGERIAGFDTADALREFAEALQGGVRTATATALDERGLQRRVMVPVIGGDDVLLIAEASVAAGLLASLWDGLDAEVGARPGPTAGLTFSAGLAVADRFVPIGVMVGAARDALHDAKHATYLARQAGGPPQPHVHAVSLGGVRRSGGTGTLFGGSIPRGHWGFGAHCSAPTVEETARAIAGVSATQRSGLLADLTATGELRSLTIDYRAARDRSRSLADAVACAGELARACGQGSPWELLRSAIFAVELGWV
ncbi:Cas10/Cmr2 second palm domain-containing protein [Rhabdothermincola sediminis]|uniref:Cas10/Cmr2 second palm domain-containing protein n=1 Tax=Rhabdothermincola sediminis TaxID=2751370 RepID=UPI001AA06F0E|nr:hypothetical protein [Rhabdothermincola sediminis]